MIHRMVTVMLVPVSYLNMRNYCVLQCSCVERRVNITLLLAAIQKNNNRQTKKPTRKFKQKYLKDSRANTPSLPFIKLSSFSVS